MALPVEGRRYESIEYQEACELEHLQGYRRAYPTSDSGQFCELGNCFAVYHFRASSFSPGASACLPSLLCNLYNCLTGHICQMEFNCYSYRIYINSIPDPKERIVHVVPIYTLAFPPIFIYTKKKFETFFSLSKPCQEYILSFFYESQ